MLIKLAKLSDAPLIHKLMMKAFMEYKSETPPSSALEETEASIYDALDNGEKALICYIDKQPVGMVRFRQQGDSLYFYRLSVIPEKQGNGIAKKLLHSLEDYATQMQITKITCKVRMAVPRNIKLYRSIGYHLYAEEMMPKPNGLCIKVASMIKKLES